MQLMHKYQQKGESLQEFNFELSELIQADMNHEAKDRTDPVKIYIYVQTLFNPMISSTTVCHTHQTSQKAMDYVQKIKREFLPVEGWKESSRQNFTL